MTSSKNTLVFTDLDGTLIDHDTYSWGAAEEAIDRLKSEGIPIIPCTSKTRTEIDFYRTRIGLKDPFISENGGAIFIPEGCFDFSFEYDKGLEGYRIIELGMPYRDLRRALDEMRSFGEFLIDGKGHDAYIAGLEDGEFVGQVVLETGQVANAIADLFPEEELHTVAIFGHSFGGYIALHVGALVDRMDFVMSSGHFLPYACINTDFAHAGQDIIAMEGVAEIYDVTALAAPTGANVDLFFGAQDSLFTSASVESFERLEVIYDKLGASGEPSIHVNPSIGHEVDPDAVIAALPAIPGD